MLTRFLIPAVASVGLLAGVSSYWGMGMYKSHKGSMSSNWEDHVEQQHSDLVEVAPGLFQVSASYYSIPKYRNMTVLQLPGGGVLVHSPIALPEATMQAIEELGKPRFLFVPNESGSAHIDLSVYQQRYPESKTICPAVIAESMKKHVNVDGIAENALKEVDSGFLFITPHMKQMQDTIIDAPLSNGQRALLVGELFWNIRFFSGLLGKLFVITKLAGDGVQPQVSSVTHTFGFESPSARSEFFKQFATYAQGYVPGTEGMLEPMPRYAAMTMQHGNPVTSEVHKKVKKVSESETSPSL